MNELLSLALNNYKDQKARALVTPGEYTIDETVRITGMLTVGKDYDTAPTVSLPVKEILALFIARAGITREHSIRLLREVASEAIAQDGKAAGALSEVSQQVEDTLATVQSEIISQLPRQPRKGPVKVNLEIGEGLPIVDGQK